MNRRLQPILDLLIVGWIAAWVVLGLAIAREVRGLDDLSGTVIRVGTAVEETGNTVSDLRSLPLVGERVARPADRIREAGKSARQSGRASRESVHDLSVLLALAIGVIPSVPLLAIYVPWRVALARERRAVRTALRTGDDRLLEQLLARRATEHVPYHKLREITDSPWRDFQEGRYAVLAAAELDRLGLDRGLIRRRARSRRRPRPAART